MSITINRTKTTAINIEYLLREHESLKKLEVVLYTLHKQSKNIYLHEAEHWKNLYTLHIQSIRKTTAPSGV